MEYSIGEFSRLTGLGIHTLRYYEHEGLIAPGRGSGNRRCYSVHRHWKRRYGPCDWGYTA